MVNAAVLPAGPVHLAIGMFDGLHLGHRSVLDAAVQSARRSGGVAAMLTFWPHPSTLFRSQNPTRLIQSREIKTRMAEEWGIQAVITQEFDHELAALPAAEFVPWLRRFLPRLAGIYVGENFRFGAGRRGDVAVLVAAGRKESLTVFSAPRVNIDGEPVSSTRIRELLCEGAMSVANTLLGYTYFAEGTVQSGKKLGRTLGFPTLNLAWQPDLLPRYGVYAVRAHSGTTAADLPGVANYGVRPTVEAANAPLLETHLLENTQLDAGDFLKVEWCHFLRPEKKFSGLDELRGQIARDRDDARAYFAGC